MDSKDYLIELRNSTGMSRKEFCAYFDIPYRTLQDWELGNRKMPDYLLRLMAYKIEMEKLVRNNEENKRNGDRLLVERFDLEKLENAIIYVERIAEGKNPVNNTSSFISALFCLPPTSNVKGPSMPNCSDK